LEDAPTVSTEVSLTANQIDQTLEEAADMLPAGVPALSETAFSREGIYTREDDWQ
jgi:hypothetical protein